MRILTIFLTIGLGFYPILSWTQTPETDTINTSVSQTDSVDYEADETEFTGLDLIARYDSISQLSFLFETDSNSSLLDSSQLEFDWPDSLIQHRIQSLNEQSPMDLVYTTDVKRLIKLYAGKRKSVTEKAMGLSALYFPLFEELLDRYEIPEELKYLPIIESALNPKARSRVGATGLWQFMYLTGKHYDLKINSYIDERRDPYKSTEAACRYLTYLHNIYQDWNLALAAYNAGPGNVNKAIRRSGGKKTYWEIRPFLPRETRSYVPAFIAMNYLLNHPELYGLEPRPVIIDWKGIDTIQVQKRVIFAHVRTYTGVDEDLLNFINPMYRRQVIPSPVESDFVLALPKELIPVFIINADSIYAKSRLEDPNLEIPEQTQDMVIHRVRSGEVLGTIAQKYNVKVRDIQEWNNLSSSRINIGQKLVIYTSASPKSKPSSTSIKPTESHHQYIYHLVREGDTLWDIANNYDHVSVDDIIGLNQNVNTKQLKPGQKIKIAVK